MLTLRPITTQDAEVFMTLRNGSDTYTWFYSNRQFTLEEVQTWIAKINPETDWVFIVEQDSTIIGTCSVYNILNKTAEVGRIIVNENARGKGIGTAILQEITKIVTEKKTIDLLYANIKTTNIRSYRAFEKSNYIRIKEDPITGYYYELKIIHDNN